MVMGAMSLADSVFKTKSELKLQSSEEAPRDEIKECFKEMVILLGKDNKYGLTAVKRKYSRNRYHAVAKSKL